MLSPTIRYIFRVWNIFILLVPQHQNKAKTQYTKVEGKQEKIDLFAVFVDAVDTGSVECSCGFDFDTIAQLDMLTN